MTCVELNVSIGFPSNLIHMSNDIQKKEYSWNLVEYFLRRCLKMEQSCQWKLLLLSELRQQKIPPVDFRRKKYVWKFGSWHSRISWKGNISQATKISPPWHIFWKIFFSEKNIEARQKRHLVFLSWYHEWVVLKYSTKCEWIFTIPTRIVYSDILRDIMPGYPWSKRFYWTSIPQILSNLSGFASRSFKNPNWWILTTVFE